MGTFPRGTLEPWYVTGFAEGEGIFTFSRTDANLGLYFAIRRPAVERPILEEIQAFFGGIGRIYGPTGASEAPAYYRVTRIRDLTRVVEHFDRYPLRGEKLACFEIWRQMVDLKHSNFRRPPREQLEELAARLSGRSRRSRSGDTSRVMRRPAVEGLEEKS